MPTREKNLSLCRRTPSDYSFFPSPSRNRELHLCDKKIITVLRFCQLSTSYQESAVLAPRIHSNFSDTVRTKILYKWYIRDEWGNIIYNSMCRYHPVKATTALHERIVQRRNLLLFDLYFIQPFTNSIANVLHKRNDSFVHSLQNI